MGSDVVGRSCWSEKPEAVFSITPSQQNFQISHRESDLERLFIESGHQASRIMLDLSRGCRALFVMRFCFITVKPLFNQGINLKVPVTNAWVCKRLKHLVLQTSTPHVGSNPTPCTMFFFRIFDFFKNFSIFIIKRSSNYES